MKSLLLLLGITLFSAGFCHSDEKPELPHLLLIGGGPYPNHNQVSLERNVEYFWRLKEGWGIEAAPEALYFADGEGPARDLQMLDPDKQVSPILKAMSIIFAGNEDVNYVYRSNRLKGALENGTDSLRSYFDKTKLSQNDELFVYYTGHGGRGAKASPSNTSLNLWNRQDLRMVDFSSMLDSAPEEVPVTILMVQCYAGGFGNVIFREGDPKKGLSNHQRCGFYASVREKQAAGCTPSVDEADYREYSSYFFAALGGQTRIGDRVEGCDLDGDGIVSFLEAHVYAVTKSDTVDVPIRTGGVFLREYSKLPEAGGKGDLVGTENFSELLKQADVYDKHILESLSKKLKFDGEDRVARARKAAAEIQGKKKASEAKRREAKREIDGLRIAVRKEIAMKWPELVNVFDPLAREVMIKEEKAIMSFLEGNERFGKLLNARKNWQDADDACFRFDEEWALPARFIRTAENVALLANLPKVAEPSIVERYKELFALEKRTLLRNQRP